MANGHSVKRNGFKSEPNDDQLIKGHKVNDNLGLAGGSADDVIIGRGGNDQLVGQDGEDDLRGGSGNDLLIGAIWIDDEGDGEDLTPTDYNGEVDAADTFSQDDFSDDLNSPATSLRRVTTMLCYQASLSLGILAGAYLYAIPAAQAGSSGTITIQGDVAENCEITSAPASVDLGELSQSSSEAIPFDFSCNAPFQYTLTSQNGALKHTTQASVAGFATSLGYGVDISLPTDGAGIADSCTSAQIEFGAITCSFTNSGTDIALNKTGGLTLNWSAPAPGAPTPLLAGNYADSLTLTISTQP